MQDLRQHAFSDGLQISSAGHNIRHEECLCRYINYGVLRIEENVYTLSISSGMEVFGWWYSGWMVHEWIPRWCSASRILTATGMKSWSRDASTCTEATSLFSESCHTCSSCSDSTPGTLRMESLTSSSDTVDGTPCNRMNDVLRTVSLI